MQNTTVDRVAAGEIKANGALNMLKSTKEIGVKRKKGRPRIPLPKIAVAFLPNIPVASDSNNLVSLSKSPLYYT